MAWNGYITSLLKGNHLSEAGIMGHNQAFWAKSHGCKDLHPETFKQIMDNNSEALRAKGLLYGDKKYFVLQANDKMVNAKL